MRAMGGEWKREQARRGVEKGNRGEEHLQNGGAKGWSEGGTFLFFFALAMCSKQTSWLFFLYAFLTLPPPSSRLSLALFLSPSLWSAHCCGSWRGTLWVALFFLAFVFVCVCVLSWIIGAELHRACLASGANEPHDEAKRAQTTTPPSPPPPPPVPLHPNIVHTHTYTLMLYKLKCAPVMVDACVFHCVLTSKWGGKGSVLGLMGWEGEDTEPLLGDEGMDEKVSFNEAGHCRGKEWETKETERGKGGEDECHQRCGERRAERSQLSETEHSHGGNQQI